MPNPTLEEFIDINRGELINRCRMKVTTRSPPPVTRGQDDYGVPLLLDQVVDELRHGRSATDEITRSATKQGNILLREGFTVGQVVHGYGDVCQSVTELAVEVGALRPADEPRSIREYWHAFR